MATHNKYLFPSSPDKDITINPLNNMANENNKILKNSNNLGQNILRHLFHLSSIVVFVHSKPNKLLEPTL